MAKKNGASAWAMAMIVRERDAAILAGSTPDGMMVGQAVAREIRRLESQSDMTAVFAVENALASWCVQLAGRACRQTKIEAAIGWNGSVVRQKIAERVSIQKRGEDGTTLPGAGQYPLWVDIPRDEYLAKLQIWEREVDERGRNVAVLRRGATLLATYPQAATLREACALAGQDISEFLLDEDAAS
jgi:hypothetical protein